MSKRKKIVLGIVILVILAAVGGSMTGDESKKETKPVVVEKAKEKEKEKEEPVEIIEEPSFTLDNQFETKKFYMTVGNLRELEDLLGDAVWVFDVEIVSKKDNFTYTGSFQGVTEDNEVVSDTFALLGDDLGDPIFSALGKKLDTGQKLKGYLSFKTEISVLEITSSAFDSGKIEININN